MEKYKKNKKMLIAAMAIVTSFIVMLTGTFAWHLIEDSSTGGKGSYYDYIVKLMDNSSNPLFVNQNWQVGQTISKRVYATSNYKNTEIRKSYDAIIAENPYAIFSDTWVRIQLEETFTKNGVSDTKIVKQVANGDVVSSFTEVELLNSTRNVDIISLDAWDGVSQGRFWILDESTGWLYWAQPVNHANVMDPDNIDQTTDNIMDAVKLLTRTPGTFSYVMKATMDAKDVELDGYLNEGAWNDIATTDKLFGLFGNVKRTKIIAYPAAINEENFPDEAFRKIIAEDTYDKDEDGILTYEEACEVEDLYLAGNGITEVTGIEYFPNLKELFIFVEEIQELDLTMNPLLTTLTILQTPLKEITMADKPDLVDMTIDGTDIRTIDLTGCTALEDLSMNNNALETLDLSQNKAIIRLAISGNQLTNLDVSQNTALEYFDASDNLFTSMDFTKNSALKSILLIDTPLTQIDISKNYLLRELNVDYADLTSLDISNNAELSFLNLNSNQLTQLNISSNPLLASINADNNQITVLDVSNNTAVQVLNVKNNRLSSLDVTALTKLKTFTYDGQTSDGTTPLTVQLTGWPR